MKINWNIPFIRPINPYGNGSIFDNIGGNIYSPPPPPVPLSNILLENGFKILMENGDALALEN